MELQVGDRVTLPARCGVAGWTVIDFAQRTDDGWLLYVKTDTGVLNGVELTEQEAADVPWLSEDGGGDGAQVLAGLWTAWMRVAGVEAATGEGRRNHDDTERARGRADDGTRPRRRRARATAARLPTMHRGATAERRQRRRHLPASAPRTAPSARALDVVRRHEHS